MEKAYELDPDSFWAKIYLANHVLLINSDIKRARTLVVGAQHTKEPSFVYSFWVTQIMAGSFEPALHFSQTWSDDWEVNRELINLREQLVAEVLFAMGRKAEARNNAQEALNRLAKMKQQGINDYRVSAAEMRAYGILGDTAKVSGLVDAVLSSKPDDAVEELKFKYQFAQSYAYAGMHDESIATLDVLLSGWSAISVPWLELDPAFKDMRDEPAFVALLEQHR